MGTSFSHVCDTVLQKKPGRAREVWQYILVINMASLNFSWDNVYNYDIIFRQLMEFNPSRSWAVTYNQMWNLSMTNPLPKKSGSNLGNRFGQYQSSASGNGSSKNNRPQGKRIKSDYGWSFNKGLKCKFGKSCRYIERCSYCDSVSHGVVACPKLERKDKEKDSNPGAGNSSNKSDN